MSKRCPMCGSDELVDIVGFPDEFRCMSCGEELLERHLISEPAGDHITNGDRIWQGGNRERAEFLWKLYHGHICSLCVFLVADDDRKQVICKRPPDKTCTDGIEAWLNAPAETEGGRK